MKVRALGEQADLMPDFSDDQKGAIDTSPLFALKIRTVSPQRHLVYLPLEGSAKAQLCWAFAFLLLQP